MKIAILTAILTEGDFRDYHYSMRKTAEDMGHQLDLLKNGEFTVAYDHNSVSISCNDKIFDPSEYDVMLNRMSVKASDNSNYYLIDAFDYSNVPYFNKISSVMKAKNKFYALSSMFHAGVPVPKTIMIRRHEQIKNAVDYIGKPPYIIKDIYGSGGSSVLIAESERAVYPIYDYLWRQNRNAVFTLQEMLRSKTNDSRDVRGIVLDGKVVAGMERIPKDQEFRANLHQGGIAQYTKLTDEEANYCVMATKSLGLEFAGVDFIRTDEGPYFIEVNSTPGIEGIQSVSLPNGIDMTKLIVDYCVKFAKKNK